MTLKLDSAAQMTLSEAELEQVRADRPDRLGALVSLTYNRGASYDTPGARYKEMRNIKSHMTAEDFERIPGDIRAMKRLWPGVAGLRKRREREARLFEQGFAALSSA
jgi:GH24 family phage-related lysozyme (muramidase)